jgi:oxygen-independent coproporphyrinogen-3 oxidase
MIDALCREMALQKEAFGTETVHTIYFGGGTPSLLPAADIVRLLEALHRHFTIAPDAEITLEANPDDSSMALLKSGRQPASTGSASASSRSSKKSCAG